MAICLLLVALTATVYAQVWRFDFVHCWDDQIYVTENVRVQNGLTVGGVRWAFHTFVGGNYGPLPWLSLMLDGMIFKDWAGGYHLTNVRCTR